MAVFGQQSNYVATDRGLQPNIIPQQALKKVLVPGEIQNVEVSDFKYVVDTLAYMSRQIEKLSVNQNNDKKWKLKPTVKFSSEPEIIPIPAHVFKDKLLNEKLEIFDQVYYEILFAESFVDFHPLLDKVTLVLRRDPNFLSPTNVIEKAVEEYMKYRESVPFS